MVDLSLTNESGKGKIIAESTKWRFLTAVWSENTLSGGDSHRERSEDTSQSDSQYGKAAIMRHIFGGSYPILRGSAEYALF